METNGKIVIVGGVATGPKVAARLRRLLPEVEITVIEQNEYISYGGCGLPLYLGGVVNSLEELMTTPSGAIRDQDYFNREKNIIFLTGTVVESIDRTRKEVVIYEKGEELAGKRRRLSYDKLVLATGAEPVIPQVPGITLPGVSALHRPQDALGLKENLAAGAKRIVIIGGGLIGLEAAEALAGSWRQVTVVEREESLVNNLLDEELAGLLTQWLEANGVEVVLGESLIKISEQIKDDEKKTKLVQTSGQVFEADMVLLACGVRANTKLAQSCGLEVGDAGGIVIDEFLTTSDPNIFAGGDCVENCHRVSGKPVYLPLASIANKQGRVIANNIAGLQDSFPGVTGTVAFPVFDLNVGKTGLTESQAVETGYRPIVSITSGLDATHYHPVHGGGTVKLVADAKSGKLLGGQVIGKGEVIKRLDVIATVIALGGTYQDLQRVDLSYAPGYATPIDLVIHSANSMENIAHGLVESLGPGEFARQSPDVMKILIDVRSQREVKTNPFRPGEALHIPLVELRECLGEIPKDKEIVTICPLGVRAYDAAMTLRGAGFNKVKYLAGGLRALTDEFK
jgi:NADPH-dependent 2,4-dienoyl-CoA reductase/sulfur reductase-like enzyme/rhodanese-related sulfurtransferase